MTYDKKAIIEGLKEAGRVAFLGALSAVILWAGTLVSSLDPTSLQYIVLTILLKAGDKFVHKSEDIKATGIAPF